MKYVLVLTVFTLLACRSLTYPPEEVQSSIVGTWSMVSDSEPHVFRMVKADSFTTFVRGFQFHEDGKLVIYGPWGCQMPPSFREYSGTWRVDKKGNVTTNKIFVEKSIQNELNRNLLIFFTGQQRKNNKILNEQDQSTRKSDKEVLESLHYIKKSGYQILDIVQSGNIDDLGLMFRDHWEMKKKLSSGVTNDEINSVYKTALDNGALGGKISGAGGGGFFTFYCNKNHNELRNAMASKGLRELDYSFDFDGSKIISNHR